MPKYIVLLNVQNIENFTIKSICFEILYYYYTKIYNH